jgi:Tol biopolymer transport system component
MKRLLTALLAGYAVITVPAGSGAPALPLASAAPGTLVFACSGCPPKRDASSLYVVGSSGKGLRRIATADLQLYYPRWSPKRRLISAESRGHEIWAVGRGGVPRRRVTRECCGSGPAAWSPDGRRLVFSRRGVPFTSTLDGKRQRRLLANWRHGFREPDWSPDGRRIVFEGTDGRVYLVRADGRAPRALARISGSVPRWSPDGRSIAFLRHGRSIALMVVRADGTGARVVREASLRERYAALAWSPNGRSIAVSVARVSDDPAQPHHGNELVIVPLNRSRPRRVVIPAIPRTAHSEFHGLDWR